MNAERYNDVLPNNINRLIKEKGLKQYAVAQRAGYSKQQFNAMLNGRRVIKVCDAMVIADALDVDVSELFKKGSE